MKPQLKSLAAPTKRVLNTHANAVLARAGHSEWMVQHAKRELWWWLRARAQAAVRRRRLLQGRGIVWTGAGRTELLALEVPTAGPGEVTVEISHTCVSPGTERAQFLALPNAKVKFPYRPGYSSSGTVIARGSDVHHVGLGDHVAVIGGSHSSLTTVSADRVLRVPHGVELELAAMITLGVIAQQGIRAAEVRPGDSVCVLGAGIVGSLAQRLATEAGAASVVVVARSRRHEALARASGATEFICLDDGDQPEARSARVTIDATGDPEAVHQAAAVTADGGRIVVLGSPRGVTTAFPLQEVRRRGLSVVGAHIATLRSEHELTGENAFAREGNGFLDRVAQDPAFYRRLLSDAIDPRDAAVFYRDLARGRVRGVVTVDWNRLPQSQRAGSARLMRLPDIRARGLDSERPLDVVDTEGAEVLAGGSSGRRTGSELRIALLGCGDIGIHNAAAVAAAPNARLVCCYDPITPLADDLARRYEADAVSDVEQLLDRADVDAVFLAVPHHLHQPLAEAAAAAGKHLIVEKPPANSLAGAKAIVDAAERAGVALTVCFPHRYDTHIQQARRLIDEGALGDFRGALIQLFIDKPPSYWWGGFSGRALSSWRSSRADAGGGILIMNLSHYIDLVRFLVGVEPATITSAAGFEEGMEVEESISVTVQYQNGGVGSFVSSSAMPGIYRESSFRLWGTDGTLELEPSARAYSIRRVAGLPASRWQQIGGPGHVGGRAAFITRFAQAIAEGSPPDIGPHDALAAQAFVEAAYRSLEEGHGVSPASLLTEALTRE